MLGSTTWVRSDTRCEALERSCAKMSRYKRFVLPYPGFAKIPPAVPHSGTRRRSHPRLPRHLYVLPIRAKQGVWRGEGQRRLDTRVMALQSPSCHPVEVSTDQ